MFSSPLIQQLALIALLLWLVQLALSYRQARLFYKRLSSLRSLGRCATGLAGGRYRGRTYVALVVHPLTHCVVRAEQLSGLTVFAALKPVPQLEGRTLEEFLAPQSPVIAGVSPKVIEAARAAAESLQKSFEKAAVVA